MKPPKKVKAWAVANESKIVRVGFLLAIYRTKKDADECRFKNVERVIPVLITPLSEKEK